MHSDRVHIKRQGANAFACSVENGVAEGRGEGWQTRFAHSAGGGFVLDQMTSKDILAWADRHHVDCNEQRAGSLLNCKEVPESALGSRASGSIDELQFAFSPTNKRLVNIATTRYGLAANDAAAQMSAVVSGLKAQLGKPSRELGQRTASYLDSAPYKTALVRYRFSDYQADVTATNLPGKGTMLREHYMSARD